MANPTTNYVVISSEGVNVASNNVPGRNLKEMYPRGHVTVTPLGLVGQQPRFISQVVNQTTSTTPSTPAIKKILLKAVCKENVKESKLFTLRNVIPSSVEGLFDVGVVQNKSSAVSFKSADDILEVWEQIRSGKNVTLWCDGMISSKKRKQSLTDIEDEEEEEPKRKKSKATITREDKIDQLV